MTVLQKIDPRTGCFVANSLLTLEDQQALKLSSQLLATIPFVDDRLKNFHDFGTIDERTLTFTGNITKRFWEIWISERLEEEIRWFIAYLHKRVGREPMKHWLRLTRQNHSELTAVSPLYQLIRETPTDVQFLDNEVPCISLYLDGQNANTSISYWYRGPYGIKAHRTAYFAGRITPDEIRDIAKTIRRGPRASQLFLPLLVKLDDLRAQIGSLPRIGLGGETRCWKVEDLSPWHQITSIRHVVNSTGYTSWLGKTKKPKPRKRSKRIGGPLCDIHQFVKAFREIAWNDLTIEKKNSDLPVCKVLGD